MGYHKDIANDSLTDTIIGKAIDIHKSLGPGLCEALYRDTLSGALTDEGLDCDAEHPVSLEYGGKVVTTGRADLWIEQTVVVELKVVKRLTDAHFSQLGRYVKATGATRGLLLNFGEGTVGVRRYTNFDLQ